MGPCSLSTHVTPPRLLRSPWVQPKIVFYLSSVFHMVISEYSTQHGTGLPRSYTFKIFSFCQYPWTAIGQVPPLREVAAISYPSCSVPLKREYSSIAQRRSNSNVARRCSFKPWQSEIHRQWKSRVWIKSFPLVLEISRNHGDSAHSVRQ